MKSECVHCGLLRETIEQQGIENCQCSNLKTHGFTEGSITPPDCFCEQSDNTYIDSIKMLEIGEIGTQEPIWERIVNNNSSLTMKLICGFRNKKLYQCPRCKSVKIK